MPFGQFIIGPPGSGKTTYANGMSQYLACVGRKVAVINLDPANDLLPYKPDVDISDLVDLQTVMQEMNLGPNGGLVYCMDYLEKNMDWLQAALEPIEKSDVVPGDTLCIEPSIFWSVCLYCTMLSTVLVMCGANGMRSSSHAGCRAGGAYCLFDLPGQAELFMMHDNLKHILDIITQWLQEEHGGRKGRPGTKRKWRDRTGKGQERTGQDRTGQEWTGKGRTGKGRNWKEWNGKEHRLREEDVLARRRCASSAPSFLEERVT
eukprot:scaffold10912_cov18-Tisochrysis_lutea.AAC.6